MFEAGAGSWHLVMLVGLVMVLTMLIKGVLERTLIPSLVGFLALGVALRWLAGHFPIMLEGGDGAIGFLSKLGLVTLLFRVGMKSDVSILFGQLKNASLAWVSNIIVTGLAGYFVTASLLGQGLVPSLIVATAFTATSVGVSVKVWEEERALKSKNGALLVDIAELDDVSGILFMGMLYVLVPLIQAGAASDGLWTVLGGQAIGFVVKLVLFAAGCFLFARFLERPLSQSLERIERRPDSTLTVVGIGFIIAALAGSIGFSLAIGAFFAGLTFSRDPQWCDLEGSFDPLFDFFSPFFFVGIGFDLELAVLGPSLGLGLILVSFAGLAKLVANWLPVALLTDWRSGALLGTSLIPRAEIALIIMQRGLHLEDGAIGTKLFGAMVVVSALTCILAPILVRILLRRWPQT